MYGINETLFARSLIVFLVILVIMVVLAFFAFTIWMFIDCLKRDEKNFKDRTLWTVLFAVSLFFGYSGIIAIIYYFVVKRELDK